MNASGSENPSTPPALPQKPVQVNIIIDVKIDDASTPAQPENFLDRMLLASSNQGGLLAKMAYAIVVSLFAIGLCIKLAIDKGDITAVFAGIVLLVFGLAIFFMEDFARMR